MIARPLAKKLLIVAVLVYAVCVTALRAFRMPNDFAMAHWLLDYRFGFVKRGFMGELLGLATRLFSLDITRGLIQGVATALLVVFFLTLIVVSLRLIERMRWSPESVLLSLVFLTSPFIVMSAHLNGYYDGIVFLLGIASLTCVMRRRPWLAAVLQVVAVLVHESAIAIIFPLFCLAWLLTNHRLHIAKQPLLPVLPLMLPVVGMIFLIVGQHAFLSRNFVALFTDYLKIHSYIGNNRNTLVPIWLGTSFSEYLRTQSGAFVYRLTLAPMHALVLPSALLMIFFAALTYQVRNLSLEFALLLGVCFAPQIMHLMAWDSERIWTYTIMCSFLALWIYAETFEAGSAPAAARILCVAVVFANIESLTPLMDSQVEHFPHIRTRLIVYVPVLALCVQFALSTIGTMGAERRQLQLGGLLRGSRASRGNRVEY